MEELKNRMYLRKMTGREAEWKESQANRWVCICEALVATLAAIDRD